MEGRLVIALLALVLLGATAPAALAQEPAPLTGRVLDESQTAVPGASVSLEPAVAEPVVSDETGAYEFPAVPTGAEYTLVAEAAGFAPYRSAPFPHAAGVPRDIVVLNVAPTATVTGPARAIRGQAVRFESTTSEDVVSYAWSRPGADSPDDGTDALTVVAYDEPGEKEVSLVVMDDRGATGTASATLLVNHPPAATLTHTAAPRAGATVTFTAAGTDADGDDLTYDWDIDGDGFDDDEGTGTTVTRRFPTSGRFTVAVRVHDGLESTVAEETVAVASAPQTQPRPRSPGPVIQPSPRPVVAADTTPPRLTVDRLGTRALKAARRRGMRFALACDEPCTVYLEAIVRRKTARKLKLGRKAKRIGRVTRTSGPGGSRARLKLTRKARKRLSRARRVKLTLQGSAWDAGGYATLYAPRKVTLRRGR